MKAVVYRRTPKKIHINMDRKFKRASIDVNSNHILVKVYSVHFSFIDYMHTLKVMKKSMCPGRSISGVVVAIGRKCETKLSIGDAVIGLVKNGLSEYVSGPEDWFIPKPPSLSHQQACVLPLSGLAAFQALRYYADLCPREEILIINGMTSVGTVAIQLAKCIKGTRITTTAARHGSVEQTLKSFGAHKVVTYRNSNPNWWYQLRNATFDVIIDCGIGENSWERALNLLRRGNGRYVSFDPQGYSKATYRWFISGVHSTEYINCKVFADREHMTILAKLVKKKKLRFEVESARSFKFDEIEAKEMMLKAGSKKTTGNLILSIFEDELSEPDAEQNPEHASRPSSR